MVYSLREILVSEGKLTQPFLQSFGKSAERGERELGGGIRVDQKTIPLEI
jgi:hypothetical protein